MDNPAMIENMHNLLMLQKQQEAQLQQQQQLKQQHQMNRQQQMQLQMQLQMAQHQHQQQHQQQQQVMFQQHQQQPQQQSSVFGEIPRTNDSSMQISPLQSMESITTDAMMLRQMHRQQNQQMQNAMFADPLVSSNVNVPQNPVAPAPATIPEDLRMAAAVMASNQHLQNKIHQQQQQHQQQQRVQQLQQQTRQSALGSLFPNLFSLDHSANEHPSIHPIKPSTSRVSQTSLGTISVNNSIGSIGSLSRLFSMGTISGSIGNMARRASRPFRNAFAAPSPRPNKHTNAGLKNETWTITEQPPQMPQINGGTTNNSTTNPHKKAKPDAFAEKGILGPWSAASAALLGDLALTNEEKQKKNRKKPKDRPKRPLSAYNIFFKEERARILEEVAASNGEDPQGKIGFQNLAKLIGKRWQELPANEMVYYKKKAETDMVRYKEEMVVYVAAQRAQDGDGDTNMMTN
mmetsp:Transcript_12506/g.29837  ORF Transcript_12506/g.29837 Transcript_12506/m.29837 type:complete len:460 (-) Transcript_12506:205-1584(-)